MAASTNWRDTYGPNPICARCSKYHPHFPCAPQPLMEMWCALCLRTGCGGACQQARKTARPSALIRAAPVAAGGGGGGAEAEIARLRALLAAERAEVARLRALPPAAVMGELPVAVEVMDPVARLEGEEVSEPVVRPELEVREVSEPVARVVVAEVSEPVARPAQTAITYMSSLEDLRRAFVESHPGWTFRKVTYYGCEYTVPSPPQSDPRCRTYKGDADRAPWVVEWWVYIYDKTKEVCVPELGKGTDFRDQVQDSMDAYRRLYMAETFWSHYTGLCKKQRAEKEKQAALQKETRAKAMAAAEVKRSLAEEQAIRAAQKLLAARTSKICTLAEKERITSQEAEAVLSHLSPAAGYQKDTRLALQVINRYAAEAGVRVEDAVTILREYV